MEIFYNIIATPLISAITTGLLIHYLLPKELFKYQSSLQNKRELRQRVWEWKLKNYQECLVTLEEIYLIRKKWLDLSWVEISDASNPYFGKADKEWEEINKTIQQTGWENKINSLKAITLLTPSDIRHALTQVVIAFQSIENETDIDMWQEHTMIVSDRIEYAHQQIIVLEKLMREDLNNNNFSD